MKHIERLQEIIDTVAEGNVSELARMLGTSPQRITMWQKRGSFDAQLVLDKLPQVSAEWLMRGNGKMLLK